MTTTENGASGPAETGGEFSYEEAFSRNLGWLTEWEQQALRTKRIAIAGMGGVGGFHLMTLTRFGIGGFNIADLDTFALVNFNRQIGATTATLGQSKARVMAEMARQVNPEVRINCFDEGISDANLDQFLQGVDLCVDGLDFFVLETRRKLNARCRELGIPVVNAAPLGMGTGFLIFVPEGMSFEEWFRLDGLTEEQQYISYLVGMAPSALHRGYLVDPTRVDMRGHRGPSTVAGCEMCAAVAGVEAVKLLLRRGRVRPAPYYHQFDAYRGRWVVRKLRGGNVNLLQKAKIALTRRLAAQLSAKAVGFNPGPSPANDIEKILDYARWAPSGDNSQPWRFEIVGPDRLMVRVRCPGDVYDYGDGEPTLLSAGFLLETLRIAASRFGRRLSWEYHGKVEGVHQIAVELPEDSSTICDPLFSQIVSRSVDRRAYRLTKLTDAQKAALAAALGSEFEIEWHESFAERWRQAQINAQATDIRLRIPEAYEVHRRIIDWEDDFPAVGIPSRALGLDPLALRLTHWAMADWYRVRRLNRLAGTLLARMELDLIPGLRSGAHFTARVVGETELGDPSVALTAGQALQRFWLKATQLGLAMQPTLAPLCFAHHGRSGSLFTRDAKMRRSAASLATKLDTTGGGGDIFRGRLGKRRSAGVARSCRYLIAELLNGFSK